MAQHPAAQEDKIKADPAAASTESYLKEGEMRWADHTFASTYQGVTQSMIMS